ncbi:MAG: DUF933 domain-containing protein [Desulfomonilaceae bacterium]|nr:DUF933 domain-containing protein [Desulfomonilaceae bacterium]
MKLGIIGLPGCGKSTLFKALTGGIDPGDRKGHQEPGLGVVKVDDSRLDFLGRYYKPKKVTPVHVEYADIAGITGEGKSGKSLGDRIPAHARQVDALVHSVRYFDSFSLGPADPLKDYFLVEEELILSDLASVEKRMERIEKDLKRGKKELSEEFDLLKEAQALLEAGKPLRLFPPAFESEKLRGFAFLSAKPELVLINAGDDKSPAEVGTIVQEIRSGTENQPRMSFDWLYADAEAEIALLSPEDAREFLEDLSLEHGAKERIVRTSFELLNLIVFFTAGDPEVRAWPLQRGQTALKAAGTVHSDMERGFIRAEVTAFEDFREAGSPAAAHKAGKVRLEGRDYLVQDGDIILFRFNI